MGRTGSTAVFGATFLVALVVAAGGGIYLWTQNHESTEPVNALLHRVARGSFELSITERGEIEAFKVTEIRSLVKSKNTTGIAILRIVPEGTEVKQGDFLVELDSSALVSEAMLQRITVNTAKAGEIESHSLFETAEISVREYLEGTYKQERLLIEAEIFVATENWNRAQDYFEYSQKLAAKGYVNELQLEADKFAVAKAEKDLDTAKSKLKVLDEFTKPKLQNQLEGAAQIANAKWEAAKNSYQLEVEKLKDIEDQIAKCTIVAPQAGIVKYAHETSRGGNQEFIVKEGALIRERQTIMILPAADAMQVKMTINESLIQYVRPGMPATITPVGTGDRVLRGTVTRVNQYPEAMGGRRWNVKEYLAFVSIDESAPELKAGLTASVNVECNRIVNALQVPVQAMYAHGDRMYCFVWNNGRWEARHVKQGPTNDKYFVIEQGLEEGDRVSLNPRAYVELVKSQLPELSPEEEQRAVQRGPQAELEAGEGGPAGEAGRRGGRGRGRGRRGGADEQGTAPTSATQSAKNGSGGQTSAGAAE
jgi:multidrug efflux pump subunit AcrA (membrane-fusion protein)